MTAEIRSIGSNKPPVATSGTTLNVSLNSALLTVQYCALVLKDEVLARELLRAVLVSRELGVRVSVPVKFRKIIEGTNIEETYKALLDPSA